MIKIAVCDDAPLELEQILKLVHSYTQEHQELDIRVTSFSSPGQLLEQLKEDSFQIYLLDILMEGKNGIELGTVIRESDEKAALIFLTSSPDYAIASYTVGAFYYILKPVTKDLLLPVLERAVKHFQTRNDLIFQVNTKKGRISLSISQVIYIEYHSHIVTYHMQDGNQIDSLSIRISFDEEMQPLLQLPDSPFAKISSAYIANLNHVADLSKSGFIMSNGERLNVSRLYPEAKRRYMELMLREAHNHDF